MRAAFLLPLALAACAALANPLNPLPEGGGWHVTAIAGAPVPTGAEVTIERPDSRGISGRAGCNRYIDFAAGDRVVITATKQVRFP